MTPPRVRILHETNPQKYFPALFLLAERGQVTLTGAHRYSVCKEWLRAWRRDRTPLAERTRNAWRDLKFRLISPHVAGEVVIMGFAPWDWRLLLYRHLARRNVVIYHTSWHDWSIDATPRQPRPTIFKRWMRGQWISFLAHPNVRIVAVTPTVAAAITTTVGANATIIPHAVADVFFRAGQARTRHTSGPLRLIYVGEVSEKKGILQLLELIEHHRKDGVTLTVVGDGPMAEAVRRAGPSVSFLGPVRDRSRMAQIMAKHDILMLLSRRVQGWEELFGIVIIEALAAGLAVLATDHVGPRGILTPVGGAGLLPDTNTSIAASAQIRKIVEDPTLLEDLRLSQMPVSSYYAIDTVASAWLAAIRQ